MLRMLTQGMVGPDVVAVQQGLNTWNPDLDPLDENGRFDSNMDSSVRQYQDDKGLNPDGIVGPITRHSLFPTIVITTAIVANVLRFPRIGQSLDFTSSPSFGGSGDPTPPSPLTISIPQLLSASTFGPVQFPRLTPALQAPLLPSHFRPFGFDFDHCEVAPGTQHTFGFQRKRQDAFVLTMQCIGSHGDPDNAHQELVFGTQFGQPLFTSDAEGNAWTFSPFVQLTDVDRFGKLGLFHFWQPYAQAGFQGTGFQGAGFPGRGAFSPTISFNAFPINLAVDVTKNVTLTAGLGLVGNYLMDQNKWLLGAQATFGVNIKIFSLISPDF